MAQRQRKGEPPRQKGGNTAFYIVLGVIALGGIIAVAYALSGGGSGGGAATEMVDLQVTDARQLYQQATPIRQGPDTAPVKIVEFADYQCPGCAAFATRVKPRVMPHVEAGHAQFIYYDFPLVEAHPHAFLAARAARCAGEQELEGRGAYWTMHDRLYQEQPRWSAQQNVVGEFIGYAEELGLDRREFERCLRSDRFAEVITANRLLGEQLGVRSTPTVIVNNRQVGGRDIQEMGDQLIQLIEEARGAEAGAGR